MTAQPAALEWTEERNNPMKKTLKVKMPLEPAIAAMEFICEHVNTMFADPKYVIAAGMATDALRAQTEDNPPLTLDELRGIIGEWVWVVVKYRDVECSGWALVAPTYLAFLEQMIPFGFYEKKAIAYRRKPEGRAK